MLRVRSQPRTLCPNVRRVCAASSGDPPVTIELDSKQAVHEWFQRRLVMHGEKFSVFASKSKRRLKTKYECFRYVPARAPEP